MNDINKRLRQLRTDELGLTMDKFGERLGVKKNTVSQWENGVSNVSDQTIKFICREFSVREEWLREGREPIFVPEPSDVLDELALEYDLSHGARIAVEKFVKLDPTVQRDILDYFMAVSAALQGHPSEGDAAPTHPERTLTRLINYYYRLASAGTGQIIFDMPPTKRIEIPDIPEYRSADYAIGVNGDSMEPDYGDGDILLVEMVDEISQGEVGIFLVDGECYVKKLGDGKLLSLNRERPDRDLDDSARCMGRVIGKLPQT